MGAELEKNIINWSSDNIGEEADGMSWNQTALKRE